MVIGNNDAQPKYACTACGSHEVRGDYDTYQVFIAEGDKIIHVRSEFTAMGLTALHCNSCHEPIEVEDFREITVE